MKKTSLNQEGGSYNLGLLSDHHIQLAARHLGPAFRLSQKSHEPGLTPDEVTALVNAARQVDDLGDRHSNLARYYSQLERTSRAFTNKKSSI